MKKIILSLVAAIVATTATYAQSLIATLTHEGNITTYSGPSAFSQAHEAAEDGDIITLSSGSFNAVTITKGITIRGAGMAVDPTTQSEPTILTNNSTNYITMKDGTTTRLTIEGVYFNNALTISATLTGATFLKSRFKSINCGGAGKAENLTMIHCKVADGLSFTSSSTFSCLNCIIWEPTTTPGEFINCVVKKGSASYYLSNATFKNCIFVGCANSTFDNTNTFFNCVGLNAEQWNLFNSTNSTNQVLSDYSAIFKTCTDGTYSDSETFELTTTAASTYKGTDGRQIGVYGGMMPFNPQPSNPQITNCTVAEKSDANGMLSIDITVQGAQ
ncbi:MAG: hypothetical protein K6A96_06315 [Prevotella sp.]|jgi:ribosomal protein S6E (S10)|nr:hypothetical protein [Prevotella sp.]